MELFKHQKRILDKNPKKCGLFWSVGTGKTLAVLELLKKNKINDALVIIPKGLKEQWEEQTDQRVITKETFRRDWNKLNKHSTLVIDELHFFLGMQSIKKKSQMLKSLLSYIKKHNPEYIYGLTGTPYMSSPFNIYAASQILGYDWNYMKFKEHFFSMINMGMRYPVPVIKNNIEKDIEELTKRIGDVVKMENCFDVPEQIYQVEYFDISKEQKDAITNLEDEGIARWTKTHQICGGTLKSDGYSKDQEFKCEKAQRVLTLAKEHPKMVIVCRYNREIEYLKKLTEATQAFTLNGSTLGKHNVIQEANKATDALVFVQSSCSEGYGLPDFPIMVFYSHDFSLKNYIQMKGRIQRADNLKKNVYLSLVTRDSIDDDVYKSIQAKRDFSIENYAQARS